MFLYDNYLKFLNVFNTLTLKQIFRKTKTFFWKTGVIYRFLVKVLRVKTHHFHEKLPCQKPMFRQIEWGVQNELITKSGVLTVTTLFSWKFCFSLRTSCKELTWYKNYPYVHIHTFRKGWGFIWGFFFLVSILNSVENSKIVLRRSFVRRGYTSHGSFHY